MEQHTAPSVDFLSPRQNLAQADYRSSSFRNSSAHPGSRNRGITANNGRQVLHWSLYACCVRLCFSSEGYWRRSTSTQKFILGDIVGLDQNNFSSERANQSRVCKLSCTSFVRLWNTSASLAGAEGPHLYDADGKQYIDHIEGQGPMIAGHANLACYRPCVMLSRTDYPLERPPAIGNRDGRARNRSSHRWRGSDFVQVVLKDQERDTSRNVGFTGDTIVKFEGCHHVILIVCWSRVGSAMPHIWRPKLTRVPADLGQYYRMNLRSMISPRRPNFLKNKVTQSPASSSNRSPVI